MQSITKLPSTQVTTMRSTTGRPIVQATKTPFSEVNTTTTTTESPSVTATDAVTTQVTTAHTSTVRPSLQLTTMKSTTQFPSAQAATKKSTTHHPSVPVTETTSSNLSTTKGTTKQPSNQVTTMKSTTERPSVQVATTTSTTKSPSVSVTEAAGGNVTTAKSTTERPSVPVTKPVSSEATTVGSTTERPSVQVTAAVGGGLTTTTSTTRSPSTHVTKAVSDNATTSTTTTEGGVIVDVIVVTNPKPAASTTPPPHNLGDIVQEAVVAPQGSPAVEGGDSVVIEVVPILNGNATSGQGTVGVWMRYGQRPYCGGVIISWLFVLTAGHCTRNKVAHDLRVSFGLSEIDPDRLPSEQQEHLIAVAAIHQNPLFKDIVHGDDISILKMSKPLQSGGYPVTPICIPEATETHITTKDIVGTEGVVAGWGRTKYGGESSKQLREVWLPIVSNNACSEIFKDILKIRDEMICAGDINGTKDACQGDSGGALMWRSRTDDRWYTLGVVSFGVKCAEPGYYGTYTRVQSYLDWICQVTDGLLCFGSSSYKVKTLPSKDMREKHLRERRSRN
ncbi:transmembrane protease serine 11A isoform X2 [Rhipicephalus sanguineus]|uniref:transmembrane protease serine 11A isoform X2 n=1 Tax=Rhipicephalus sanguineus TaxID=34632 RepID=UPI001893184B|nr:transmembrane protease serine 11A isoform X2 [Rhipicephalus sanguineus]